MEYKVNNLLYAAGEDLHNTIRSRIEMTEPVDAEALGQAPDHFEINDFVLPMPVRRKARIKG